MEFDFAAVEKLIGYQFHNKSLLKTAFTHTSYGNLHGGENNERMEFLGNSVLDFIAAEYLYLKNPDCREKQLSLNLHNTGKNETLKKAVERLGIYKYLLSDNLQDDSDCDPCGDLYEAVLCAIYLDGGIQKAREFVLATLKAEMDSPASKQKDAKTLVKEFCERTYHNAPQYKTVQAGPQHDPTFESKLYLNGKYVSTGHGKKIVSAEQDAAQQAIKLYQIGE